MATDIGTDASASTDADAGDALDGEPTQGTPLPRAFLVEAAGPATVVRDRGDVVERTGADVDVSHRIETLEEFGAFWALRTHRHAKRDVVHRLLGDRGAEGVRYEVDADEWDVLIDGHVQAFFGVAEAIVTFHVVVELLAVAVGDVEPGAASSTTAGP